jgi:hypothetical protein
MHIVEGSVDVSQWLSMRNELVHLQLAVHIVGHEIWELCPSLDTSERATLPYTACDELESWRNISVTNHMLIKGFTHVSLRSLVQQQQRQ